MKRLSICAMTTALLLSISLLAVESSSGQEGKTETPNADAARRPAPCAPKSGASKKNPAKPGAPGKGEDQKKSLTPEPSTGTNTEQTWNYVRVVALDSNGVSLDIEVAPFNDCKTARNADAGKSCQQIHLAVQDTGVRERVKQLHAGDRINVIFSFGEKPPKGDASPNILNQFCMVTAPPVSPEARWGTLLISALICLLIGVLWTRSSPLKLIIGEDGRYSNSQFQIAVWFFVLIVTYISTVWIRVWFAGCDFIGGVDIPKNLLLISGMSVVTFGGAKAITTNKVADEKSKPDGREDAKQPEGVTPNFFKDLTHNDGKPAEGGKPAVPPQLDFGDFQMLIITLVAVATYLVLVFDFLG